ncbi:hypothetical protein [Aeromonas bestiarum]|uniref:hypothetical protein n=1 Tax=Aeromonas bestiarum TaxID=105751 RepID=UPI000AA36ABD|nr:hypothetical protein [Aeromonas bestiarum]
MLKLLDYGRHNPFRGIIGRTRNLAWPVNAYRVTLPITHSNNDGLNPFERVILKLLEAVGVMDARALADETRIPLDLVKSVLLRLQGKAFIDEYNVILKREDENSESEDKNAPEFVTALLFRELASGKILPFLHVLNEGNPLRKREAEKSVYKIVENQAHKQCMPAKRNVISALRAMKKQSAMFGKDNQLPTIQQITIAHQPELHYLDCPIAIQKSDGEFRIADPFGGGFSLTLEKAFEQLLEQDDKLSGWLRDWKLSLSNPYTQKQNEKSKEPFDSEANRQRYPKLIANLRPSRNMPFRSIAQIYASIEWALFYTCCRHPFEHVITRLKLTAQAEHYALLAEAAERVGLASQEPGFRAIREGKLIDFQNEKAELETVLAIAILQASSDESHPLRRIAASHINFIHRLLDIKSKRGERAHGKGGADVSEKEFSEDPFMREIIHKLVPEIVFADTPVAALDKDLRADSLLDARASIQNEFGFKAFNRLGANLQERLVHAERFWLSCESDDDALGFVSDLYAAVQSLFGMALSGKLPPDVDDTELIKTAENKAVDAALCKEFPDSLNRVKPSAIRQTLQGSSQTLGACVITFLLMADDDTLRALSESQPSFVNDMVNIISRRGHGNEPLPLPKDDIALIRKSAFTTIKTLMEA